MPYRNGESCVGQVGQPTVGNLPFAWIGRAAASKWADTRVGPYGVDGAVLWYVGPGRRSPRPRTQGLADSATCSTKHVGQDGILSRLQGARSPGQVGFLLALWGSNSPCCEAIR